MIQKQLPDGTPYEVLEPGDPPKPVHDADACGQCTFVAHPDFIRATSAQVEEALPSLWRALMIDLGLSDPEHLIVPLGLYTLPGWTGHNTFWLFQCPSCETMCADYLHGWRLYLKCGQCGEHLSVEGNRFYEAAGHPTPPSRLKLLMHAYRQRWKRRQQRRAQA